MTTNKDLILFREGEHYVIKGDCQPVEEVGDILNTYSSDERSTCFPVVWAYVYKHKLKKAGFNLKIQSEDKTTWFEE